jgi:hypothetical protein
VVVFKLSHYNHHINVMTTLRFDLIYHSLHFSYIHTAGNRSKEEERVGSKWGEEETSGERVVKGGWEFDEGRLRVGFGEFEGCIWRG